MDKAEFLKGLEFNLLKMNHLEKNKFITYYDEMISDYIEDGMKEEEAVNKVGTPAKIAEELWEDYRAHKFKLPSIGSKLLNVTLIILGFPLWGSLLLTAFLLLLSAYMIIWCIPVITGAGCVGFLLSAVIGMIGAPLVMSQSISIGMIQLGTGVASIGISALLGCTTMYLSKKFIGITRKFNVKLKAIFNGRR